ncbi:hypothetical protein, partial [Streptococcus pneumoniae]
NIQHGGTSLAIQWLRLRTSNAGNARLIPDQGTKIPYAMGRGQKKKKEKNLKLINTIINSM